MQNILNIKEKLEEQARMDFGMAMVRLMEEEEKLSCLQDRKTGYEEAARGSLQDTLCISKIRKPINGHATKQGVSAASRSGNNGGGRKMGGA